MRQIFESYGVDAARAASAVVTDCADPDQMRWVDFMMRFELGLEEPDPRRALRSALHHRGSYVVGGLIPLSALHARDYRRRALRYSIGVTLLALASSAT